MPLTANVRRMRTGNRQNATIWLRHQASIAGLAPETMETSRSAQEKNRQVVGQPRVGRVSFDGLNDGRAQVGYLCVAVGAQHRLEAGFVERPPRWVFGFCDAVAVDGQ